MSSITPFFSGFIWFSSCFTEKCGKLKGSKIYHPHPKKVLMLVYVVSQIKGLKINDDQMIPTANPPKPFPIVFLEN